jgi:putative NIF3 family GTP cyclohydrolase 1 type 2
MGEIEIHTELTEINSGPLSEQGTTPMTIGELAARLGRRWPMALAESWDHNGLSVGDPARTVKGVAVALDVTTATLARAEASGANVLLTHHPALFNGLDSLVADRKRPMDEQLAFRAAESGMALMNFHTPLDLSNEAQTMLPGMLRLSFEHVLDAVDEGGTVGYGQVCHPTEGERLTVGRLASRCTAVFAKVPRVWGDMDADAAHIATWTGSAGEAFAPCLAEGIDVLVCGEVKYHEALAAQQSGLAIIELGHDVSEMPFVDVLARACVECGIPRDKVLKVDGGSRWTTPETRRV